MLCTEEASEEFAQMRKRNKMKLFQLYPVNFAFKKDLKNYSLSELLQKQHTALYMFLRSPDSRMQFLMSFLGNKILAQPLLLDGFEPKSNDMIL